MQQLPTFILVLLTSLLLSGCQSTSLSENTEEVTELKTLSLEWVAPVERENGELLTEAEIGGFEILYRDTDADSYESLIIDTTTELITEYDFSLSSGDYEFKIAAFDTDGLYSSYSDAATITVE